MAENLARKLEKVVNSMKANLMKEPRAFEDTLGYVLWHDCFEYFIYAKRYMDGISLSGKLYDSLMSFQKVNNLRLHKGDTLWLTSLLYDQADFPWHSRRFRLLAVCEDALTHESEVTPTHSGDRGFALTDRYINYAASYPFLMNELGLTNKEIETLFRKIRGFRRDRQAWAAKFRRYPEALLSHMGSIDRDFFDRCSPRGHQQRITYFMSTISSISLS